MRRVILTAALLCLFSTVAAQELIYVHLRNPVYCDGILQTTQGGVISGPSMRMQAQNITYHDTKEGATIIKTVTASGEVMIQYGETIFIGDHLEYNFESETGVIHCGRSGSLPWYFRGETIYLYPGGNYRIEDGMITTSEDATSPWHLQAKVITVDTDKNLNASRVTLRVGSVPILWLPKFRINLNSLFDHPVRYSLRWGGRQGPRIRVIYEALKLENFKAFLRLDYRITRGPGAGIETTYLSPDHKTYLETINYIARDNSLQEPNERLRYRYQGVYHGTPLRDYLTVDMTWDKLSDKNMATDYEDKGIELDTAGRTELRIRQQCDWWVANLLARVRINDFQTVKQQLPTFEANIKPFVLGPTGIVSDTLLRASYLNFKYSDDQPDIDDFNSPRVECTQMFYRPFGYEAFTLTPYCGTTAIFYGNNADRYLRWTVLGRFGAELNVTFSKAWDQYKHIVIPYASYEYDTYPTTPPNDHFIFDITDGLYRINMIHFGARNHLFYRSSDGCIYPLVHADIYTNSFFKTPTITGTIPKVYADLTWNATTRLRQIIHTAWDLAHQKIDYFNVRQEWTVSNDAALAIEYRHRDRFCWRKAQYQNFVIDSFRPISELVASSMSDPRDTVLFRLFWRFQPTWALECDSRFGWRRPCEPNYSEYNVQLVGTFSSAWNLRLGYRHKEDEDRFAIFFTVGVNLPVQRTGCEPTWIN